MKKISTPHIIDNPLVLRELGVDKVLKIQGSCQVFENETYKFIVIDAK